MSFNLHNKSFLALVVFFSILIYSGGLIVSSDKNLSTNSFSITDSIDENRFLSQLSAPVSSSSVVSTQSVIIDDDLGNDSAYNIVSYDVASQSKLNLNYVTSSSTFGSSSPSISPINWTDVVTTTRILINNTTSFLPYRATTGLVSNFNINNLVWVGSGFMVAPNIMITAAHMVYADHTNDEINNPAFAQFTTITPGQNGTLSPYGTTYAKKIYIPKEYYLSPTGYDYDWAIVKTNSSIGNSCGYFGMEWSSYGSFLGQTFISSGYPTDKYFNGLPYQYISNGGVYYDSSRTLRTFIESVSGQSGSAIYENNCVAISILTFGVDVGNNGIDIGGGTKISQLLFEFIEDFLL